MKKNISQEEIAIKVARILIEIGAVSFRFDPPFTFTSGLKSPIYLDNRLVLSYPTQRKQIIKYYIEILESKIGLKNIDYISGTASAAIPQASWIAGDLEIPMVYVRPSSKKYGKGNKLEGYLKKGSRVVVIEDHISTAGSVVNNVETIRGMGGEVKYCVATTSYQTDVSRKALEEANITLYALTTGKIIVEQAQKTGHLTGSQKKSVDLWFENPGKWAYVEKS